MRNESAISVYIGEKNWLKRQKQSICFNIKTNLFTCFYNININNFYNYNPNI